FLTLILGLVLVVEVNDYRRKVSRPLVVISQDGVVVRKGNGTSYPTREEGVLNRGVEAYWLFTRGSWHQIELAGGEVGWVHDSQVLMEARHPLGDLIK
ncbi:MAG TPA: SH3 domain-containing protein, partial [Gemmataceae bacterium]|nr:SH3 domain-containing protein [Gemmataceae bacterium]